MGRPEPVDSPLDQTTPLARALSHRIWNDRELDHGLLQLAIGIWMAVWPTWIPGSGILFFFLPASLWATLHSTTGILRITLSPRSEKSYASYVALFSCSLYSLQGLLSLLYQPRAVLSAVFLWLGYQGLKSYLRLAVTARR